MRDMSRRGRGRRCLLGFIFSLLFIFSFLFTSSCQTINGAPSALLRPTRQHILRSIPVLSSSLGRKDDVALFLSVRRRNSGKKISSGKEENNYRCNSAISWGQHLRSKLFALCTTLFSSPVTARSVYDTVSKKLCRLMHHRHLFTSIISSITASRFSCLFLFAKAVVFAYVVSPI